MTSCDPKKCILDGLSPDRAAIGEKEAILAEVRIRLRRSPYHELHSVQCDFHEGVLSLLGNVPSYFFKQVAQSIVFSIERVEVIDNRLEIITYPSAP
jgi:hypothetical protein